MNDESNVSVVGNWTMLEIWGATQVKLCLLRLQVRLLCSFNAEKLQKPSFGGSERFKLLGRSTQPL